MASMRSRRRSRLVTLALCVTASALIASACGSESSSAGGDGSQTYKIGYIGPNTGSAAVAGQPLLEGVEFAVEEINETGFLGENVELELLVEDDAGDPAKAISAWDELVDEDVSAVICCGLSSVAGALKPKVMSGDTPAVISSAILPGLPELPKMYRTALLLADPAYEQLIGAWAEANPDARTAMIGITADSDGMVHDGEVWKEALEEHGIEVVGEVATNTGDTDFAGPATQVIDKNPDLFIANMLSNEATLMIKTLRERGFENEIFSTYGLSSAGNYEVGGAALDGVVFPQAFAPESTVPEAQAFTRAYEQKTGKTPDVYAAQGYTAVYFIAQAIKDAGGDPADVATALSKITEMDSVYGPISFEDGQAVLAGEAIMLQWNADGTQSVWDPDA